MKAVEKRFSRQKDAHEQRKGDLPLFDARYTDSYNGRSRFPVWCLPVTPFFDAF